MLLKSAHERVGTGPPCCERCADLLKNACTICYEAENSTRAMCASYTHDLVCTQNDSFKVGINGTRGSQAHFGSVRGALPMQTGSTYAGPLRGVMGQIRVRVRVRVRLRQHAECEQQRRHELAAAQTEQS
eukprot:3547351-Pleurochrysis_carterae.AAC.2